MKVLHKIKPYPDNKLEFDEDTGRYQLTFQFCKDKLPNNYVDDEELKRRIALNTMNVYGFVNYRIASFNRKIVDLVLHGTKEGRKFLFDLLYAQMEADIETAYNDLVKQPAINMANGQNLDRMQILANQVSVQTEQIFDTSDSYFGFFVGYQAPLPRNILMFIK